MYKDNILPDNLMTLSINVLAWMLNFVNKKNIVLLIDNFDAHMQIYLEKEIGKHDTLTDTKR
jgi:hypothetical protein